MKNTILSKVAEEYGRATKLEDLSASDVLIHGNWVLWTAMKAPENSDGSIDVNGKKLDGSNTLGDLIDAIESK